MTAGCASNVDPEQMAKRRADDYGQYWQRITSSDAIYTRGPKAQQMLNQDIARCVREVNELERLGALPEVIPADENPANKSETKLDRYDTPERDGALYREMLDYHDFETCMYSKGWERVRYVPYDVSAESRDDYVSVITGRHYRSDVGERAPEPTVLYDTGPNAQYNP